MKTLKPKFPTVKVLNELVIAESTKLKKLATKEEIERLSFETLNTKDKTTCIYGQMTGNCFSTRATTLIEESCKKVLSIVHSVGDDEIKGTLNGSPKETHRNNYWSPIESFIDKKRNKTNGNNKRLIDFIKGETDTLKLK